MKGRYVLSKKELEKPRTPKELKQYFWDLYDASLPEEKQQARLKKDLWKNVFEELNVLNVYSNWKFPDNNAKVYYKVGNQGYDAIIKKELYEEYVEITFPHIGEKEHQESILVNKNGYSLVSRDLDEIMQRFISTAKSKSLKDYNYDNSSLIFALDLFSLPTHENGFINTISLFVKELHNIAFKVKNIYVVLLNSKDINNKVIDVSATDK